MNLQLVKEFRKLYGDYIATQYCLTHAYQCLSELNEVEAKEYFDYANAHLYSFITGKNPVKLYLDIKEELKEYELD